MRITSNFVLAFGLIAANSALSAEFYSSQSDKLIKDQYIVVYKDNNANFAGFLESKQREFLIAKDTKVIKTFSNTIKGFAVKSSKAQIEEVLKDDSVLYVEQDRIISLNANQESVTWGIDRIDSRFDLDNTYNFSHTGEGVHAYIVDTGVNSSHVEFADRMAEGFTAVEGGTDDCNGHGTHVAGTVGGSEYGVAKNVTIHPVRVLNCKGTGTLSGVIAGVDWVANNAILPAVANMSLGGGKSEAIDDAVRKAVEKGISFVVAAGNSNADACNASPAAVDTAITVGATDSRDKRASFSNWGNCVDVFAPGVNIKSAWKEGESALNTISGTSMAAPHVAGIVALYLEKEPELSPAEVFEKVSLLSTQDIVTDPKNSPNLLVFSDPDNLGPQPRPEKPENPCGDSCKYTKDLLDPSSGYVQLGDNFRVLTTTTVEAFVKAESEVKVSLRLMKRSFFRWREVKLFDNDASEFSVSQQLERGRYRWEAKSNNTKGFVHFWSKL